MGLFDKMKDAQAQAAQAMQQGSGTQMGASGGMAGQMAYAQMAQKLHQSGVEAHGVVHTITPTGNMDMGGGQEIKFEVSIKPADGGEPYQTTITQSMLPAQLEGISEGSAITVKYDPDSPTSALIYGW
jgi:hypothetical protein